MTWMNDYDTDAKKNAITDGVVTLGTPRHVDISAGYAYVVIAERPGWLAYHRPVMGEELVVSSTRPCSDEQLEALGFNTFSDTWIAVVATEQGLRVGYWSHRAC